MLEAYHIFVTAVTVLRPDFTSKLVHVLAFGTPKFYIAPYDKIKHELVNLSSNCDVKSGLKMWCIPFLSLPDLKQVLNHLLMHRQSLSVTDRIGILTGGCVVFHPHSHYLVNMIQ